MAMERSCKKYFIVFIVAYLSSSVSGTFLLANLLLRGFKHGGPWSRWQNEQPQQKEQPITPQTPLCNYNEKWTLGDQNYQRTCENPEIYSSRPPLTWGCFCIRGLLRAKDGRCVEQENCPNICGENEIFSWVGSACQRSCDNPYQRCNIKTIGTIKACYCKDGYARNKNGDCIPISECRPKLRCGTNEYYDECGIGYQRTCSNCHRYDELLRRGYSNCVPGCYCSHGFVRREDNRCGPIRYHCEDYYRPKKVKTEQWDQPRYDESEW